MKVRLAFSNAGILMTGRQSLVPVVMSGIIAVYGLVVSVLISGSCKTCPLFAWSLHSTCSVQCILQKTIPSPLDLSTSEQVYHAE